MIYTMYHMSVLHVTCLYLRAAALLEFAEKAAESGLMSRADMDELPGSPTDRSHHPRSELTARAVSVVALTKAPALWKIIDDDEHTNASAIALDLMAHQLLKGIP